MLSPALERRADAAAGTWPMASSDRHCGLACTDYFFYRKRVVWFRWNEWNVEHIARHGVRPEEAEDVVNTAKQPYPMERPDAKWLVWGQTRGGRSLQVVFILDPDDTVYVIHARDLTAREKQRLRRRMR